MDDETRKEIEDIRAEMVGLQNRINFVFSAISGQNRNIELLQEFVLGISVLNRVTRKDVDHLEKKFDALKEELQGIPDRVAEVMTKATVERKTKEDSAKRGGASEVA